MAELDAQAVQTFARRRVPGLTDRLVAGARVLDLGCGTGHAVNLMAQAYPCSTFVGYDIAADAIDRAERERVAMELPNARFDVLDVAKLPADPLVDFKFSSQLESNLVNPFAPLY